MNVADRRAELLQAAGNVIRRVGFERMRLRDVAQEAGVSIGLLQHYFETREQLGREAFAAVCGARARGVAERAEDEGPAWVRIQRMLEYAFEPQRIRERASTWLDLCASASRDGELRREAVCVQDVWRAPLEKAIADGQATGELRPRMSPAVAVDLLLAVVDGTELAATIGDVRVPADQMLTATLAVTRDLLGVRTLPGAADAS
ncbi:MAG: TetR/AcrR family transcriptional regulator [Streptosporangiaceae bacterium]